MKFPSGVNVILGDLSRDLTWEFSERQSLEFQPRLEEGEFEVLKQKIRSSGLTDPVYIRMPQCEILHGHEELRACAAIRNEGELEPIRAFFVTVKNDKELLRVVVALNRHGRNKTKAQKTASLQHFLKGFPRASLRACASVSGFSHETCRAIKKLPLDTAERRRGVWSLDGRIRGFPVDHPIHPGSVHLLVASPRTDVNDAYWMELFQTATRLLG